MTKEKMILELNYLLLGPIGRVAQLDNASRKAGFDGIGNYAAHLLCNVVNVEELVQAARELDPYANWDEEKEEKGS